MRKFVKSGDVVTFLAPYTLLAGQGFQVGSAFAVASCDAASGAAVEGAMTGVYDLAKVSAQAWTVGQKIFWDNTDKLCTTVSTAGQLIGVATKIAANPSATGHVRLNEAVPALLNGSEAAIADIATADATDLATAEALANALKASYNTLLAELRLIGAIS